MCDDEEDNTFIKVLAGVVITAYITLFVGISIMLGGCIFSPDGDMIHSNTYKFGCLIMLISIVALFFCKLLMPNDDEEIEDDEEAEDNEESK